MELLTVRGYTDELWRKYARGPQVFVRQATQSTVRVVRPNARSTNASSATSKNTSPARSGT